MKNSMKKPVILIYFILLCCVFIGTAFSRYDTTITGDGTMQVAEIVLEVSRDTNANLLVYNQEQQMQFTVKNYRENGDYNILNDTTFEYQIQISLKNTPNMPMEYHLYKIVNNAEEEISLTNSSTGIFVTGNFTMTHSQIQEDTFKLKIKMDDKTYKNITDEIDINVYATQQEGGTN